MLTGPELGAAIARAIELKHVTKKAFADAMGVKPASVQDWVKYGRIAKGRLSDLVEYFKDVVGPEHWGLYYVPLTPGIGKTKSMQGLLDLARAQGAEEAKRAHSELSKIVHGISDATPENRVLALIVRSAIEAQQAGVPPEKLFAIYKILVSLREAQDAVSGANRQIENFVADAELPSDKEVQAALTALGLAPERGATKDGQSTHRGHSRKSG